MFRLPRRDPPELADLMNLWRQKDRIADAANLPRKWVICPICGAHDWRDAPHGLGEPCPIIVDHASSQNMKTDAERNLAARSGLHLERQIEAMTKWFQDSGLLPKDDEENE